MNVDLSAAAAFMTTHARVLDRRRFELMSGKGDPASALAALDGYRNADGGDCLDAIRAIDREPHAYVLAFAVRFLDAVYDDRPEAVELLDRLRGYGPADGLLRVEGGTEEERLRPLDVAPYPGPARTLLAERVVAADLDRLAGLQRDDGGWTVDYAEISPGGTLDWRGHVTVRAIAVLRANGVI